MIQISLAPLDSTDAALCRSWRNHWEVWRWCRQTDMISDVEQGRWFQAQALDPTIRMYKVQGGTEKASAPVGVCGLTSIHPVHRTAEFSLYIAPEAQKRGLGSKALELLFDHGFSNLGLNMIWGESFADNPAMRLFARLGMHMDGTRRQAYWKDGRFIDCHLYSITAEDWNAGAQQRERHDADPGDPRPIERLDTIPRVHPDILDAKPGFRKVPTGWERKRTCLDEKTGSTTRRSQPSTPQGRDH